MMATQDYARSFADLFGVPHAFPFWKGRVALYAILRALGIGPGDEVIIPGYTCVMNVNPVMYVGASPIYVDIEPNTFNLDAAALAAAITPKTKLIIAQHTYGYPADLDAINSLTTPRGITVVEDCCLALGSRYKGKLLGTFGAAAYFSSQWSKPYTTGLGGMAITADKKLADSITKLCRDELLQPSTQATARLALQYATFRTLVYPRTIAWATRAFRWLTRVGLVVGSSDKSEYTPEKQADFFTAMSSRQMRWGLKQLSSLNKNIARRKTLAELYDRLLAASGWPTRVVHHNGQPVLVRYPLRVKNKAEVLAAALKQNMEIGSWFESPLHPAETPLEPYRYEPGQCPVAEKACREVVNLPLHPRVTEKTAKHIVEFLTRLRAQG